RRYDGSARRDGLPGGHQRLPGRWPRQRFAGHDLQITRPFGKGSRRSSRSKRLGGENGLERVERLERKYSYETVRHGISRRSKYCTKANKATASSTIVSNVAKSAGVLNEAPKVISITPKPTADKIISLVTIPRIARPIPSRIPAMIMGRAAGRNNINKKTWYLGAKERAHSRQKRKTVPAPAGRFHGMMSDRKRTTRPNRA